MAHLSFSNAQEALLVAEINLDIPTPKIALQQRVDAQSWIGADQKSRLTVEQLGAFVQPVAKWSDDQKLKLVAACGLHRAERPQGLYSKLTTTLAHLGLDGLELARRISQEFLRRGSLLAIKTFPSREGLDLR